MRLRRGASVRRAAGRAGQERARLQPPPLREPQQTRIAQAPKRADRRRGRRRLPARRWSSSTPATSPTMSPLRSFSRSSSSSRAASSAATKITSTRSQPAALRPARLTACHRGHRGAVEARRAPCHRRLGERARQARCATSACGSSRSPSSAATSPAVGPGAAGQLDDPDLPPHGPEDIAHIAQAVHLSPEEVDSISRLTREKGSHAEALHHQRWAGGGGPSPSAWGATSTGWRPRTR